MTLTARGQFTFNKALMEHIGVKAGDRIVIKKTADGWLKIGAERKMEDVESILGMFKPELDLSLEEIDELIRQGYIRHGTKGLE
jgi:bifunctional DNA-binding transcriptional regulator/antitoxin component of YhaV-PrlF toxin-antitoxin module